MHVRRKSSRTDRALGQAKDLGAQAQAKAVDTAAMLSEKAQTTLVPAAEEAAKRAQEKYREDVKPALANLAATATAAATAGAEAAREEAAKQRRRRRLAPRWATRSRRSTGSAGSWSCSAWLPQPRGRRAS